MPRSVNSVAKRARRKKIMKQAKGFFGRRKNVWTVAINAGVRQYGMSYSEFIGKVNAKNINLNRKVLADLAMNHPEAFKAVVKKVK